MTRGPNPGFGRGWGFLVTDGRLFPAKFLPNVRLMDFQIDVRSQLSLRKNNIKIACTIAEIIRVMSAKSNSTQVLSSKNIMSSKFSFIPYYMCMSVSPVILSSHSGVEVRFEATKNTDTTLTLTTCHRQYTN